METPINCTDLIAELAALEHYVDSRVQVWRVVVDATGTLTGQKVYRGSFRAPHDYAPPTFEQLMDAAQNNRRHND